MLVLSPDHFLYNADGLYEWTPERCSAAWAETMRRAQEAISGHSKMVLMVGLPGAGKSTALAHPEHGVLYIDATFVSEASRKPFILMAQKAGKDIEVLFVDTPVEVCIHRNNQRTPDRKVPETSMGRLIAQLQKTPPQMEEGFSQIVKV